LWTASIVSFDEAFLGKRAENKPPPEMSKNPRLCVVRDCGQTEVDALVDREKKLVRGQQIIQEKCEDGVMAMKPGGVRHITATKFGIDLAMLSLAVAEHRAQIYQMIADKTGCATAQRDATAWDAFLEENKCHNMLVNFAKFRADLDRYDDNLSTDERCARSSASKDPDDTAAAQAHLDMAYEASTMLYDNSGVFQFYEKALLPVVLA
jgi:hypothetical protein